MSVVSVLPESEEVSAVPVSFPPELSEEAGAVKMIRIATRAASSSMGIRTARIVDIRFRIAFFFRSWALRCYAIFRFSFFIV